MAVKTNASRVTWGVINQALSQNDIITSFGLRSHSCLFIDCSQFVRWISCKYNSNRIISFHCEYSFELIKRIRYYISRLQFSCSFRCKFIRCRACSHSYLHTHTLSHSKATRRVDAWVCYVDRVVERSLCFEFGAQTVQLIGIVSSSPVKLIMSIWTVHFSQFKSSYFPLLP